MSSTISCESKPLCSREKTFRRRQSRGGALFLEDGVETGNVLRGNLAVYVRTSSSLLNEDVTPAAFWVSVSASSCHDRSAACIGHQSEQHR